MDSLENKPVSQPSTLGDLQAQCESLRQTVLTLLVLVLIISGTLNIYFQRQYRTLHAEVKALSQIVAEFEQKADPSINDLARKLLEFQKKNPDIAPLLSKYGIKEGAVGAAPAPATGPVKK